MAVPKINSAHGSDTRNVINRAIEVLNQLGINVQDLVAEGQLTSEQYAQLITVVNGLISKGEVSVNDINKNLGKFDATFFTSKFLQELNDGEIVATEVLPNSLTNDKYARNSVSAEKTDFIKVSTNLVNIQDAEFRMTIDADTGEVIPVSRDRYVTPFFEIRPSSTYYRSGLIDIAFYDSNKNFISISRGARDGSLDSPNNAYYCRVSTDKPDTVQLNRGDTKLPYEPGHQPELSEGIKVPINLEDKSVTSKKIADSSIGINHLDFINQSSNLIDIDNFKSGYNTDAQTGEEKTLTTGELTPFIAVNPNTDYIANGLRVSEYDNDYNFITSDALLREDALYFTTSQTTAYLKITYHSLDREVARLNVGQTLLPYEDYFVKLKGVTLDSFPDSDEEKESKQSFFIDTSLEGVFNSNRQFEDFTTGEWHVNDSEDVYAMVDAIQVDYPEYITKQSLTPDATGLEISAYHLNPKRPQMSNQGRYPKIFIVTGTHGYERSSVLNMYHLVKELCEHWKDNELIEAIRFNVDIIWIPIVNPHGWTVGGGAGYQRTNSNGVDIARQFPDDWVLGDPDSGSYGGEAPLTEIEALNVKQIFDENPDIDAFYDYHNFGGVNDNYIWVATASTHTEMMSESLIKKMSRKWSNDFNFLSEGDFFGYTSRMAQGTMHNYAYQSLGIKRSATFETGNQFHQNQNSVRYDQDSCKAGLESIVNFLIINLRDIV